MQVEDVYRESPAQLLGSTSFQPMRCTPRTTRWSRCRKVGSSRIHRATCGWCARVEGSHSTHALPYTMDWAARPLQSRIRNRRRRSCRSSCTQLLLCTNLAQYGRVIFPLDHAPGESAHDKFSQRLTRPIRRSEAFCIAGKGNLVTFFAFRLATGQLSSIASWPARILPGWSCSMCYRYFEREPHKGRKHLPAWRQGRAGNGEFRPLKDAHRQVFVDQDAKCRVSGL